MDELCPHIDVTLGAAGQISRLHSFRRSLRNVIFSAMVVGLSQASGYRQAQGGHPTFGPPPQASSQLRRAAAGRARFQSDWAEDRLDEPNPQLRDRPLAGSSGRQRPTAALGGAMDLDPEAGVMLSLVCKVNMFTT